MRPVFPALALLLLSLAPAFAQGGKNAVPDVAPPASRTLPPRETYSPDVAPPPGLGDRPSARCRLGLGRVGGHWNRFGEGTARIVAMCMGCKPALSVTVFASEAPQSAGETIEARTASVLAYAQRRASWQAEVADREHERPSHCSLSDVTPTGRRMLGGLPFAGLEAVRWCQFQVPERYALLDAQGSGCRFEIGAAAVGQRPFSAEARADIDRVLDALSFTVAR